MTRREQREAILGLLFETEFHKDESADEIYVVSAENREIDETTDPYVKGVYFGIMENLEDIDGLIGECAHGWKTKRLSRVSRAVLRLAVYEIKYVDDVPATVAINEGIELSKKYDDEKAKAFINGVLNAVKDKVAEQK